MYVYLGVLIVLFLLAVTNRKAESASAKMKLSLGIIFLVMALKAPLLGDYKRYVENFYTTSYSTIKHMAAYKGEIGFHAFTKAITYLTNNPSIYLAITSAFICILLGIYIDRFAASKIYAVYFYFTIGLFAFSMAGLRQVMAMSICLLGYEAIKKKRLLQFIIIIGVAFLFHKTAIFFLPAYPIARLQWKWRNLLLVFTAYGMLILSYKKLISYLFVWLGYQNFNVSSPGNGEIFTAILLFIGILAIINKDRLLQADRNNIIFINLHCALVLMWFFRFVAGIVERPSFYYLYATIILLDQIFSLEFEEVTKEKTHKFIIVSALLLFGALFLYRLIRDINLLPYIPIYLSQ
jgi:hypothetical protein